MFSDRGYLGNLATGFATDTILGRAELCGLTRAVLEGIADIRVVVECVVVAALYFELAQILTLLWTK